MNNWDQRIDQNAQNFLDTFEELTAEQLNWKPHPETWSIAQNIDHLIVINESYFPIIESARKGTYKPSFLSKIRFMVSYFGKVILKSVQADRKYKIKTFAIWEPAISDVPNGILERFSKHQTELKNLIKNAKDLLGQDIVISSPANRNIVYKLETAFEIIVTHEQDTLSKQGKSIIY